MRCRCPVPAPVIATAFCGGFRCLGRQYSSSFALACGYAARLPYGEVSGGHPDGVIELRLLPPGFTEPGCTGIDLMPSQDQIRAVAQDVVPALRTPAQRAAGLSPTCTIKDLQSQAVASILIVSGPTQLRWCRMLGGEPDE